MSGDLLRVTCRKGAAGIVKRERLSCGGSWSSKTRPGLYELGADIVFPAYFHGRAGPATVGSLPGDFSATRPWRARYADLGQRVESPHQRPCAPPPTGDDQSRTQQLRRR